MSPPPFGRHQEIVTNLVYALVDFVRPLRLGKGVEKGSGKGVGSLLTSSCPSLRPRSRPRTPKKTPDPFCPPTRTPLMISLRTFGRRFGLSDLRALTVMAAPMQQSHCKPKNTRRRIR